MGGSGIAGGGPTPRRRSKWRRRRTGVHIALAEGWHPREDRVRTRCARPRGTCCWGRGGSGRSVEAAPWRSAMGKRCSWRWGSAVREEMRGGGGGVEEVWEHTMMQLAWQNTNQRGRSAMRRRGRFWGQRRRRRSDGAPGKMVEAMRRTSRGEVNDKDGSGGEALMVTNAGEEACSGARLLWQNPEQRRGKRRRFLGALKEDV